MAKLGEIRRTQAVSTYGPGALIPVEEHSYMVVGLDSWEVDDPTLEIREPRLERRLDILHFKLPPSSDSDDHHARDLPAVRFPKVYSCADCHQLGRFRDLAGVDGRCAICAGRLVTSRFVVVCERGHVDDFPYHRWAHRESQQPENTSHQLKLVSEGRSASLKDVVVECSCGARNSMGGALGKSALKGVARCSGNQPWLRGADPERCDLLPRGVQRGASNVWQPVTESAISIPPWSERASRFVDRHWLSLEAAPVEIRAGMIERMLARTGDQHDLDEVLAIVHQRDQLAANAPPSLIELRQQEYDALRRGRRDDGRQAEFVCEIPDSGTVVPSPVEELRLVKRLREVRALTGFYRLTPPATDEPLTPLSRGRLDWLPAIEVSGEGIYMGLDLNLVRSWEQEPSVLRRIARLGGELDSDGNPLPEDRIPTARRVLVHTLAHVLIDQWSLACGYPSASLRERLYIGEEMAGALIYTATSDSAGSLGGVVGLARSDRFRASLLDSLTRAAWCSNDPLCMESGAAGLDARNLGACHACVLLAETSCELANTLLDRGVLVGSTDGCPGFFAELLRS
jgi:hypothetical protein